jgi:hypothetical protein
MKTLFRASLLCLFTISVFAGTFMLATTGGNAFDRLLLFYHQGSTKGFILAVALVYLLCLLMAWLMDKSSKLREEKE